MVDIHCTTDIGKLFQKRKHVWKMNYDIVKQFCSGIWYCKMGKGLHTVHVVGGGDVGAINLQG